MQTINNCPYSTYDGTVLIENCEYEAYVGTTSLAIYKIEGDTFTMAGSEPGSTVRPELFNGDSGARLFVLTKQ